MKSYVLDSYALLAYCEGEKGAPVVAGLLKNALREKVIIFLSVINWGEMYYIALREGGNKRAELYRLTIARYPIELIAVDEALTLKAAAIKAFHKISYADAFAAALAKEKHAELVTGDSEFEALEKQVSILWI